MENALLSLQTENGLLVNSSPLYYAIYLLFKENCLKHINEIDSKFSNFLYTFLFYLEVIERDFKELWNYFVSDKKFRLFLLVFLPILSASAKASGNRKFIENVEKLGNKLLGETKILELIIFEATQLEKEIPREFDTNEELRSVMINVWNGLHFLKKEIDCDNALWYVYFLVRPIIFVRSFPKEKIKSLVAHLKKVEGNVLLAAYKKAINQVTSTQLEKIENVIRLKALVKWLFVYSWIVSFTVGDAISLNFLYIATRDFSTQLILSEKDFRDIFGALDEKVYFPKYYAKIIQLALLSLTLHFVFFVKQLTVRSLTSKKPISVNLELNARNRKIVIDFKVLKWIVVDRSENEKGHTTLYDVLYAYVLTYAQLLVQILWSLLPQEKKIEIIVNNRDHLFDFKKGNNFYARLLNLIAINKKVYEEIEKHFGKLFLLEAAINPLKVFSCQDPYLCLRIELSLAKEEVFVNDLPLFPKNAQHKEEIKEVVLSFLFQILELIAPNIFTKRLAEEVEREIIADLEKRKFLGLYKEWAERKREIIFRKVTSLLMSHVQYSFLYALSHNLGLDITVVNDKVAYIVVVFDPLGRVISNPQGEVFEQLKRDNNAKIVSLLRVERKGKRLVIEKFENLKSFIQSLTKDLEQFTPETALQKAQRLGIFN